MPTSTSLKVEDTTRCWPRTINDRGLFIVPDSLACLSRLDGWPGIYLRFLIINCHINELPLAFDLQHDRGIGLYVVEN